MSRRQIYTKVKKTNQIRAPHVKGAGDRVYKGFQCLNPDCTQFIVVPKAEVDNDAFVIECPKCGYLHAAGFETKFYDYDLEVDGEVIESGEFAVSHSDYIEEAPELKYCIVCNALKPLDLFDKHAARASGRQGECRMCKAQYNAIKNKTRTTDQHRESGQRRRLYSILSGTPRIDSDAIGKRYNHQCFRCGKDLRGLPPNERPLDHTLPVVYLWPLTTQTATLLCKSCNGEKAEKWLGEFYDTRQLKELAVRTGIPYETLQGPPHLNPEAVKRLRDPDFVDEVIVQFAPYKDDLIKLRNRILRYSGLDLFKTSRHVNDSWIQEADDLFNERKSPQFVAEPKSPDE